MSTRRVKRSFKPEGFDRLEDRVVMSTTSLLQPAAFAEASAAQVNHQLPILTTRTLNQVIRQVDRAFTRAASSGNIDRLRTELSIAASRLPYGRMELLPLWLDQVDMVVDRPSLGAAYHGVRGELANYVTEGVDSGLFAYRVTGNLGRNAPLPGQHAPPQQQLPVLTTRTLNQVIRQVDRAFTRAASSGNIDRLRTELSIAASRLPYGRMELLPLWLDQVDMVVDRLSLGAAYHGVRGELANYVQVGVDSGLFVRR